MPPETEVMGNSPEARTETGELKTAAPTTTTPSPAPTETPKTPVTPEVKADGETLLTEKKADEKADSKGPPATYADFTAPEGYEFDKEKIAEAVTVFKEAGLSQDQAQKVMDVYAKTTIAAETAPYKLWEDQQKAWREEVKSDPVIGGRIDQVRTEISRLLDSLGEPKLVSDFKAAMDFTGAGNNPAFIRAFHAIAQKYGTGTPVAGGGPSPQGQVAPGTGPKSVAKAMYPNLP